MGMVDRKTILINICMHDESLGLAISQYIFDNEDMYRRMYVPSFYYMRKHPNDHSRVMELVDNACKKFSEENNIPYEAIQKDVKKMVAIEMYKEMMSDEITRDPRKGQ